MTTGAWIAIAVLLAATAFGLWRRRTDGHFRGKQVAAVQTDDHLPSADESDWGHPEEHLDDPHDLVRGVLGGAVPAARFGERATLVQFSSAFCAPCRVARRVLGEVAEIVPGVNHVEVDAEAHLDIVRVLGILRTPTTVVVDAGGREVARAVGAPRKEQVLTALAEAF